MRYNCQAWGIANNYITNLILILQKAALRIMTFSQFRAHSAPLFSRLNILTIFDLVKMQNVLFVHRVLNYKVPDEVGNYFQFTLKSHEHNTRESRAGCLEIPNVNSSSYGIKSLSYQSISTWNWISRSYVDSIESQLINCKYSALKHLLKQHFLSQYN